MPIGSSGIETPLVLTGSIPSDIDVAYADIGKEDRRLIAASLSGAINQPSMADDDETEPTSFAWTNPESGNSGTISEVNMSDFEDTGCLAFTTTANTIGGVRLYSGTACRDISKKMAITTLTVAKS